MAVTPQRYPSPLRYPGGKGKLSNFVKLVFLENDLVGSEYVEPYAGGASVALSLLFEEYASHIHINDFDRGVSALWRVVLDRTDEFCKRIERTRINTKEWQRQKSIQSASDLDELDLAFSTFFLNRTSRSGIIGGGAIGGLDQEGPWKIDARFNRKELIHRVQRIARFRNRITATGYDAADYLRRIFPDLAGRPTFLFLDPPYYARGARLYQNFYEPRDHEEIARLVETLHAPWIVSYDARSEIRKLYGAFTSLSYDLQYTAATRHVGSERMYLSPGLKAPRVKTVASVPRSAVDRARNRRHAASSLASIPAGR